MTTATVKIPNSFAISAITGLAPVPVPPPKPAVINNISVSDIAFAIASLLSFADALPIPGSIPAPRPLVVSIPICIFVATWDCAKS